MSESTERVEITEAQKERAAHILHNLPFSKMLGMRLVDLRPGEAAIEIEMHDNLRQPAGLLHGGVTASLIDTAMAYAVISTLGEGQRTSTVDLTVHYLRPHTDGKFTCIAKVVRAGKRLLTVSADVLNEEKKLIATAISTYTRVERT